MQFNTSEECFVHVNQFNSLSVQQLLDSLHKWIKQPKKNKKQPIWNSLFFNLSILLMPDLQISQLLIHKDFFIEKVYNLLSHCRFKIQTLFNGVQIKLSQAFVAFDTSSKLQKVIMEGNQIKDMTPIQKYNLIKRGDMTCQDRKQKMLIYNRQKNQKTTFLTTQLKAIQRTKNDLFKQDHSNKMKFFTDYLFGQTCPTFCASGINILQVKQNQWLMQKTHLQEGSIYIIYSGSLVCYFENSNKKDKEIEDKNKQINFIPDDKGNLIKKRLTRNYSVGDQSNQKLVNKLQLSKGSIIQSTSFIQILSKMRKQSKLKLQSCKALQKSIIFEIKSSQFYRAVTFDEKSKKHFMNQYEKVLTARKILFTQSFNTLNKYINKNSFKQSNQFEFSICRKKNYKGFRRNKTSRSSLQDLQNLATVQIYQTMIKNKQKVLSLQKEYKQKYKQKNKSQSYKINLRYQDNKKLKQNYKRMKLKDFQIQKLAISNSVSNLKDFKSMKTIKTCIEQVKGIFQDDVDNFSQRQSKQVKKVTLMVQNDKQNKGQRRRGIKLKSYSPQPTNYFKYSLNYSKTYQNSKRVSLGQSVLSSICADLKQQMTKNNFQKTDRIIGTKVRFQDIKDKSASNISSNYEIMINGKNIQSNKFIGNPLKCITNEGKKIQRKPGRKVKTTFKPQTRRLSNFNPNATNLNINQSNKIFP